jgi:antitoxin (DNA-binding transcriptional repressor) of toxin-antitoxin stability system
MKTVTTREVQHHFARVLQDLSEGGSVQVTRRGEVVAVLSPPPRDAAEREVDWGRHIEWHRNFWKGADPGENPVLAERESYDR